MNRLTLRQSTTQCKTQHNTTTTARFGALLAVASLALAGCGATADASSDGAAPAAGNVAITDGWVKAADSGMSAAFGELTNSGADDVTVVSATTEAASTIELHETVENETGEAIMREIDGGFVIPAGGTLDLEPGGSHIMLMGLTDPLEAGEEVSFTLTFSDDSTYEFAVPVKDFSGANENYQGGDAESDTGGDAESDTGGDAEPDMDHSDSMGTDG